MMSVHWERWCSGWLELSQPELLALLPCHHLLCGAAPPPSAGFVLTRSVFGSVMEKLRRG